MPQYLLSLSSKRKCKKKEGYFSKFQHIYVLKLNQAYILQITIHDQIKIRREHDVQSRQNQNYIRMT